MLGSETSLESLRKIFKSLGVQQILVKELAKNDNSKNQPYLGRNSLEVLNVLPIGAISEEVTKNGNRRLKAPIPLDWLRADGSLTEAPNSQAILYPQYPEVRLSGFLRGTKDGPNALMASRDAGRILFLGITQGRRIVGWVVDRDSNAAREFRSLSGLTRIGLFFELPLDSGSSPRDRLLRRLGEIHRDGWLRAQRLNSTGTLIPCNGTNCGGYTLEAQLGVIPNSDAEPDFEGFEIKAHAVPNFDGATSGRLTLLTPEPTGGFYKDRGAVEFVKKYGYADRSGIPNRLNFSSPHNFGLKNELTNLTLILNGCDLDTGKITDLSGGFALVDSSGKEAAVWHFRGLIEHWSRKHRRAAYVPYLAATTSRSGKPCREYKYGPKVQIGDGTDIHRFLLAVAKGLVNYDPGIKLENTGQTNQKIKLRSQLRIASKNLGCLYATFQTVTLP